MSDYKSIFYKFSFGLIVSLAVFFIFSHPASADYYDYIPGVGNVKVEAVGMVNGVFTVNIKDASGNIIASGVNATINEQGRGVPILSDLAVKSNNVITTAVEPPTHVLISDALGAPVIDESVRYYQQFGATNLDVLQRVLFGFVDNPANPIYGLQTTANARELVAVVLRNEGIITDQYMSFDAARNLLINAGMSWNAASSALGTSPQGPVSASAIFDLLSQSSLGGSLNNRNLTISGINNILSELHLTTRLNIRDNNGDGVIQREELFNSASGDGDGDGDGDGNGTLRCSLPSECSPCDSTAATQSRTCIECIGTNCSVPYIQTFPCYIPCTSLPSQLPSCNFYANPTSIIPLQSSSLFWTCQNVTNCSISQGIGSVSASGTKQVKPSQTITYVLTCRGPGGSGSWPATVNVGFIPWIREIVPR